MDRLGPLRIGNGSGSRYSDGVCKLRPCRVLGAAVVKPKATPTLKGNPRWVEQGHGGCCCVGAPAAVTGLMAGAGALLRSGRCEVASQAGEGVGPPCPVQFASRIGSGRPGLTDELRASQVVEGGRWPLLDGTSDGPGRGRAVVKQNDKQTADRAGFQTGAGEV